MSRNLKKKCWNGEGEAQKNLEKNVLESEGRGSIKEGEAEYSGRGRPSFGCGVEGFKKYSF